MVVHEPLFVCSYSIDLSYLNCARHSCYSCEIVMSVLIRGKLARGASEVDFPSNRVIFVFIFVFGSSSFPLLLSIWYMELLSPRDFDDLWLLFLPLVTVSGMQDFYKQQSLYWHQGQGPQVQVQGANYGNISLISFYLAQSTTWTQLHPFAPLSCSRCLWLYKELNK